MDARASVWTGRSNRFACLLSLFAILPAFLGGSTERWTQGLVLVFLGLIFILNPPGQSLGRNLNLVVLGLLFCAGAAFLPAAWFNIPAWRITAIEDFSFRLNSCVTPQPWLTAEAAVVFACSLAWLYYLCSKQTHLDRHVALRSLCAGIVLLAAVSIGLYLGHWKWPVGNSLAPLGPFPNRNQTADLFAIGAVLSMACMHEDFRHRKQGWLLWLGATCLLLLALVLTGSRAGIILCFAGAAIWAGGLAALRRSAARFGAGAGFLLILLGLFLLWGGDTLDRFIPRQKGASPIAGDLRWLIQKDALELARSAPLMGIGLGNFEAEFALAPHSSLGTADYRILHPESDWIWLLAELGWPGVLLVVGGAGILASRIVPLGKDPDWRLRAAAATAALIFAAHGVVDVSAHRLGSAFPALLVCSMALLPRREANSARWLPILFRSAGFLFCITGVTWLFAEWNGAVIPGKTVVESMEQQAIVLNDHGEYESAVRLTTAAIEWAPLNWTLYHQRAVATALGSVNFRAALADFRRARFLNTTRPEVPFTEGLAWLKVRPILVVPAWQEALERAGNSRAQLFAQMLESTAKAPPEVQSALIDMAEENSELVMVCLLQAKGPEFHDELTRLLGRDPELDTLTPSQKEALFRVWPGKDDPANFTIQMERRDEWMRAGWVPVVELYAARGDYKHAYEKAMLYLQRPTVPDTNTADSVSDLRRALYFNPRNYSKGYALYIAEIRKGKPDEALRTLQKFTAMSECPGYFHFLKAEHLARSEKWQEAWVALKKAGSLGH